MKMLNTCPFCGGDDIRLNGEGYKFVLSCQCGARMENSSYHYVVKNWNARHALCVDEGEFECISITGDIAPLLYEITQELANATAKHPVWPTDAIHACAILAEESGELIQAAINFHFSGSIDARKNIRNEAIQTGAMALRVLLNFDSYTAKEGLKDE